MLQTLYLMNEVFYIIGAVLIAFLAVEVVDVVFSLVLVLPHCLHRREALIAVFERTFDPISCGGHGFDPTRKAGRNQRTRVVREWNFAMRSIVRKSEERGYFSLKS